MQSHAYIHSTLYCLDVCFLYIRILSIAVFLLRLAEKAKLLGDALSSNLESANAVSTEGIVDGFKREYLG